MSKSKEPSEADIVFNRANIALVKNQRLVASWLPARTDADLSTTKSQEELDREEEEMFAPVPELLGVGAVVPKDKHGLPRRSEASALDKLRTQLLGKKAVAASTAKQIGSKPNASAATVGEKQVLVEESDEEEGRAAAFSQKLESKARKSSNREANLTDEVVPVHPEEDVEQVEKNFKQSETSTQTKSPRKSKRASNFMDELLQQKGKKKRK